jgi:hypothetical protein
MTGRTPEQVLAERMGAQRNGLAGDGRGWFRDEESHVTSRRYPVNDDIDLTAELDAAEAIMMGRTPALPVPEAAVLSILRTVIADPAGYAERRGLGGVLEEPMAWWQARAVLAAFAKAGWMVMPTAPEVPGAW